MTTLEVVTDEDLAEAFGVSRRTIQARARRGELPTPLSTRPLRWSSQQIAKFLDGADRNNTQGVEQ